MLVGGYGHDIKQRAPGVKEQMALDARPAAIRRVEADPSDRLNIYRSEIMVAARYAKSAKWMVRLS